MRSFPVTSFHATTSQVSVMIYSYRVLAVLPDRWCLMDAVRSRVLINRQHAFGLLKQHQSSRLLQSVNPLTHLHFLPWVSTCWHADVPVALEWTNSKPCSVQKLAVAWKDWLQWWADQLTALITSKSMCYLLPHLCQITPKYQYMCEKVCVCVFFFVANIHFVGLFDLL